MVIVSVDKTLTPADGLLATLTLFFAVSFCPPLPSLHLIFLLLLQIFSVLLFNYEAK